MANDVGRLLNNIELLDIHKSSYHRYRAEDYIGDRDGYQITKKLVLSHIQANTIISSLEERVALLMEMIL